MAHRVDEPVDLNDIRGLQVQLKVGKLGKILRPQMKAKESGQGPRTLVWQNVGRVVEVAHFTRTDRVLH